MEELGKEGGGQGKADWGRSETYRGHQELKVLEEKEESGR